MEELPRETTIAALIVEFFDRHLFGQRQTILKKAKENKPNHINDFLKIVLEVIDNGELKEVYAEYKTTLYYVFQANTDKEKKKADEMIEKHLASEHLIKWYNEVK